MHTALFMNQNSRFNNELYTGILLRKHSEWEKRNKVSFSILSLHIKGQLSFYFLKIIQSKNKQTKTKNHDQLKKQVIKILNDFAEEAQI